MIICKTNSDRYNVTLNKYYEVTKSLSNGWAIIDDSGHPIYISRVNDTNYVSSTRLIGIDIQMIRDQKLNELGII